MTINPAEILHRRTLLNERTSALFSTCNRVALADHNQEGYYHSLYGQERFTTMKKEWAMDRRVPPSWIAKGDYPGIWLAMFSHRNTAELVYSPLFFLRFYFKSEYAIFNSKNPDHQQIWEEWSGKNLPNPWAEIANSKGIHLEQRMKGGGFYRPFPHHKRFYEEYAFGAALGYSDYITPVIVLEDSVADIDFIDRP